VLLLLLLSPGFRMAAAAIPAHDPAAGLDPWLEAGLRQELVSLKGRYRGTLLACRPGDPAPVVEESPPELPDPAGLEGMPPSSGDAADALEAAAPPPPPPRPKPRPKPQARPAPGPAQPPPPAREPEITPEPETCIPCSLGRRKPRNTRFD
jgi:hypothetical protein